MSKKGSQKATTNPIFDKIVGVLNRDVVIDALPSLVRAVKNGPPSATLSSSAIIIDANAVLRIPSNARGADVIDYITGVHQGPVILPGQVVQEFWNNQASAATTIYNKIKAKHHELSREVEKALETLPVALEPISIAVAQFKEENDHIFDNELVSKTSQFLERLSDKVKVPYAPRSGLDAIAVHRKRAKTPPGFEDKGDGDFLVWVDALFGLSREKRLGASFTHVILITNDKKLDWCRGHMAHPILHAEMKAIVGAEFEVWTIENLIKKIDEL